MCSPQNKFTATICRFREYTTEGIFTSSVNSSSCIAITFWVHFQPYVQIEYYKGMVRDCKSAANTVLMYQANARDTKSHVRVYRYLCNMSAALLIKAKKLVPRMFKRYEAYVSPCYAFKAYRLNNWHNLLTKEMNSSLAAPVQYVAPANTRPLLHFKSR